MTPAGASWDDSTPAEALDTVEILCAHIVCRNLIFICYYGQIVYHETAYSTTLSLYYTMRGNQLR